MTYEILGYKTKEDFENFNFIPLEDGITSEFEAVTLAEEWYENEPYAVIKIQSEDREFIKILDKHINFKEDDY